MNLRLFINPYHHGTPERDAELFFAFNENRRRGHFGGRIVTLSGRPTFNDFFKATRDVGTDTINIIANSDIYFDGTLGLVKRYYGRGGTSVMALSRWDVTNPDTHAAKLWRHRDSQDAWIFPGPVDDIPGADFCLGQPGCDNRIARLLVDAGHTVINPSEDVKAYHIHLSGHRNYGQGRGKAKVGTVPGPYHFVEPSKLFML